MKGPFIGPRWMKEPFIAPELRPHGGGDHDDVGALPRLHQPDRVAVADRRVETCCGQSASYGRSDAVVAAELVADPDHHGGHVRSLVKSRKWAEQEMQGS